MRCLVPLVPLFAERYPEIVLELAFADRRVDLVAEGLDLAIRLGSVQDESLVARRLGEPEYKVTRCITTSLGFGNFNQMVNTHWIARARQMLADPALRDRPQRPCLAR